MSDAVVSDNEIEQGSISPPHHEAQLVQGPLVNTATPVTESESASTSLARTQAEHPELQQLAMMSGGVKQLKMPYSFSDVPAGNVARGIIKKAKLPYSFSEDVAKEAMTPSPRPDFMSGQKYIGGAQDIHNIETTGKQITGTTIPEVIKPVYADGGSVDLNSSKIVPDSDVVIGQDLSDPEAIADARQAEEESIDQRHSPLAKFGTALEGAAESGTFGLSTKAETGLGISTPEDIQKRREDYPGYHTAGNLAGLFVPGAPEAKALTKVGELGAGLIRGSSTLSKIGAGAVKGAVENAMFQGGDEVSKNFAEDPNQSAQTAISDIGLSGLLGGTLGAGFGAVSPLFEHTKASKFIDEFKSRLNEHLTNPDLGTQAADNLSKFYTDTSKGSDSLFKGNYDETGLRTSNVKDKALEKLVPPINEKIMDKGVGDVTNHFMDKIQEMKSDPDTYLPKFTKALEKDFSTWQEIANNPNSGSYDVFKASEDLKRTLQARSKIGIPIDNSNPAFDSIKSLKDSAAYLRKSLEDTDVWGDAGKFQKNTNEAFSKFLQPLKEFNRSFTTVLEGQPTIDPDKVQTYLNQVSREKGVVKGQKLQNYLDAADKFRDSVNEAHEKIGIAGPFEARSKDAVNTFTDKLSSGAKSADSLVKGIIEKSAGESAGALGGVLAGWPGYMVGKHVIGPVLDSVVPSLIKPILGSAASGTGLKHALDYIAAFSKGETAINKSVKAVFTAGKEILPANALSSQKDISNLDKHLKSLAQNPEPLTSIGGSTSHYLPNHGLALAKTAMNAVNYLNSQRPSAPKVSPLDSKSKVNPMEKTLWDRTLDIANQPLTILNHIKQGTIQPGDVKTISTLYPDLYNKISQKLITQISGRDENSDTIPYKTKMGMSIFLGKAMDSTMLPESIIAAQPAQMQNAQVAQQPQRRRGSNEYSAKTMEKVIQSAQTPTQARSSYRQQAKA